VPQIPSAVAFEGDRFLVVVYQPLVHDVEHLEEARVGAYLTSLVGLEAALVGRTVLTPYIEGDVD